MFGPKQLLFSSNKNVELKGKLLFEFHENKGLHNIKNIDLDDIEDSRNKNIINKSKKLQDFESFDDDVMNLTFIEDNKEENIEKSETKDILKSLLGDLDEFVSPSLNEEKQETKNLNKSHLYDEDSPNIAVPSPEPVRRTWGSSSSRYEFPQLCQPNIS